MEIQIAGEADIAEITRVEIECKLQSFPELTEEVDIDYAIRAHRWKTYFAGQSPVSARPERVIFKAMDDGRMIGYLAVHLTTRYNKDAEIQSFYILKEYQRKGIGLKLLKMAVQWLGQFKARSLCVGIASDNPYRVFYLKHGGEYLNPHWIVWGDITAL